MQPILAHLSAGNSGAGDGDTHGLHPLPIGDGVTKQDQARGLQILVRIDVDKACLIGYHVPPSTRQAASASSPECRAGGKGDASDTDQHIVALRLPLLCANVRRGSAAGRGRGPRSCDVAIVMPPRAVMLEAQGLSLAQTVPVPKEVEGAWVLEFGSEKDLKTALDTLQAAGCIMDCVEERYDIGQALGYGSTAKVCIAEDQRTGEFVAVKITTKVANAGERDRGLTREAYVLRSVRHPNVLQFRGIYEIIEERTGHRLSAMVTEFLSGGELFEEVKRNGPMEVDRATRVAFQLFSAVAYLHPRGIIHRDIKTENVILNGINDGIKLVDFGLATPEWDAAAMSVRCGSPGYIAPEVLRSEKYGCKVDCFSLGVLVYIMLVGYGPFRGRSLKETFCLNMQCEVSYAEFSQLPAEAKDFTAALLTGSPDKRPSAEQCLKHPWLKAPAEASAVLETRKVQRTFSKELAQEDIYFQPLRFAESPSLPASPWDSQHFSSRSGEAPTMACSEFSPEVAAVLQAPENAPEGDECQQPPAGMPQPQMFRTLTPLWADVQKSLADMHAKGQLPFPHPDRFSAFFSREMKRTGQADDFGRKTAYFHRDIKRDLSESAEKDAERNSAYFMDSLSHKDNTDDSLLGGYSSGSDFDICLCEDETAKNAAAPAGPEPRRRRGARRQVPVDRASFGQPLVNRPLFGASLEGADMARQLSVGRASFGVGEKLDGADPPRNQPVHRETFFPGEKLDGADPPRNQPVHRETFFPGDASDRTLASHHRDSSDRSTFGMDVSADGIVGMSAPADDASEALELLLGADDLDSRPSFQSSPRKSVTLT